MLWEEKSTPSGNYATMKTPSAYKISWEDLDRNSYRSVSTGNLIRKIASKKWFKGSFTFNYLTENEAETILTMINNYPLYIRIKSPLFGTNGVMECQVYVSQVSISMQRNKETGATWQDLTFNLVQCKKIAGQ